MPDYLEEILNSCATDESGAVADYIPELAAADPNRLGVCVASTDGAIYGAGDTDFEFTIQSISKPFAYGLALREHGLDAVLEKVDVEPSGEAFNELSLEGGDGRPLNPMINAGALTVHGLIGPVDATEDERAELVRAGLSTFAGRELTIDTNVRDSELATAYRNVAIANMLRGYDLIEADPDAVVHGYITQCAVRVTLRDLTMMAATLANGGVQPITGEQVLEPRLVRQVLSVMMTCGMYDSAGDWMSTVGFPAKSGVSGGIIGVLPGQVGIATFSPRLDEHGTSVRGVRLCTRMSDDMGMHIMTGTTPAESAIRRDRLMRKEDGALVRIGSLQGTLEFSSAERVLRELAEESFDLDEVVVDMRRVTSVNDVARRMLREGLRRLRLDDVDVTVVDPERMLGEISDDLDDLAPGIQLSEDLEDYVDFERIPDEEDTDEV